MTDVLLVWFGHASGLVFALLIAKEWSNRTEQRLRELDARVMCALDGRQQKALPAPSVDPESDGPAADLPVAYVVQR